MSSKLLRVASEHSSVVAVVGRGHLAGIKKHWKQPLEVNDYFLTMVIEIIYILDDHVIDIVVFIWGLG